MSHIYNATVTAKDGQRDAEDIAKRRAWDDGYKALLVVRSHRVGLPTSTTWAVELVVEKRA